jgi:hypothetical protein
VPAVGCVPNLAAMMDDAEYAEEERLREERARERRARAVNIVVTLVRTVCGFAALVLAAHVLLTIGGANPDNGITRFVDNWSRVFALGFRDLFTPRNADLAVIINYGIAALFWLIVAAVITRILRRATSPYLIS